MPSIVQSRSLTEAAKHYSQNISAEALGYLEERGISDAVAQQYSLGTVTDPINGHEMHQGWLSIPYMTANGICVGYKFRRLDDGKPKYGSPTGQKAHLYNVSDITIDSSYIAVCEGELDALVLSGLVGIPAVGVPGVQAWKPHFVKLFTGYDTVFVIGDNDIKEDGTNPGAEFAKRVAQEVSNSTIVTLPPSMDINDFYLTKGLDATKALLLGQKDE
jgi:DNA primase